MAEATERSVGITASERYLAKLAEHSFLNLWSYPNLYREKKQHGSGDGKELCDLLVVCGDHVLIFSDKTISWPAVADVGLAWSRWFRRAVEKSVKQICGAERWIAEHPDLIFLDKECSKRLPIELPPPERRKVHCIVVALGAGEACKKHFGGGSGSLFFRSSVVGRQHFDRDGPYYQPFIIGDVNPTGSFIHVLDDTTLDIVMQELDTISDLTHYLEKKATFARSGRLLQAHGEEDLVAYYATRMNADEEHDFTNPDGRPWKSNDDLTLDGGQYLAFIQNPKYFAKKEADEVSYVWDRLIETFTSHMLAGTTLIPPGATFSLEEHEQAVRYMALETRFRRRNLSEAVLGALEKGKKAPRFFRAMVPAPTARQNETGFFIFTLDYLQRFQEGGGYDEYRKARVGHLHAYALGILQRYRYLKRVVGIATEPIGSGGGRSEDALLFEPGEWTPELEAEAKRVCKGLGILQEPNLREYAPQGNEFPDVQTINFSDSPAIQPRADRRQRRILEANKRKASRRKRRASRRKKT